MEAIAQTQVFDAQGNLVLVPKPVEAPAISSPALSLPALSLPALSSPALSSPSRSRRAPDSPIVIPPELADKDPLALKLESALKRSIADRTGDLKLKQEAAFQQSLADKMGARAVMSKEQLERTKKEAEQLRIDAAAKQSTADRTGDAALKKEAAAQQHLADKLIASANKALAALADPTKAAASPVVAAPSLTSSTPASPSPLAIVIEEEPPLIVQVLQDALDALLESAAQKQSQADRTGDLKLKQEAAVAQSKVDKMRAQLTNELKRSSGSTPSGSPSLPTPQLNVVIPNSPRFAQSNSQPSSPQRSPHPRAPPAELSFLTSSAPAITNEKYKPPAQRAIQAQQAVRQRSPQLAQFTAAAAAASSAKKDEKAKKEDKTKNGEKKDKDEKKKDKNQGDKPADRTNAKSWRRRDSYTPTPPSPSIPSNENKQPNKVSKQTTKDLKPLPIKITKVKMDATTNCSEEEFEVQA